MNLLVCKSEPEDIVCVEERRVGGEEKEDIAYVKLHPPNLWSIKQNRICNIFACNLRREGVRR